MTAPMVAETRAGCHPGRPRRGPARAQSTVESACPTTWGVDSTPGTEFRPVWQAMTAGADSAPMPSRPRMCPSVGRGPRALASVLMLRQVPPADLAAPPPRTAGTSAGASPHCLSQVRAPMNPAC